MSFYSCLICILCYKSLKFTQKYTYSVAATRVNIFVGQPSPQSNKEKSATRSVSLPKAMQHFMTMPDFVTICFAIILHLFVTCLS